MNVPWARPNIKKEDIQYMNNNVLNTPWLDMGKQVNLLEERMTRISNRKYAVAVNNGTCAIEVMLKSLNIGIGDEVIVPALTYIASAFAVSNVGAKPVFVDVNYDMTIDADKVRDELTENTKGILSVDLGGAPCQYDKLEKLCNDNDIYLLVDGAQSLQAEFNGRPTLSYGICSTTSFHIAKVLTSVQGGMIFTNDESLYKKMRLIRNEGEGNSKYIHREMGGNYRLTDVLASLLIKQLDRLSKTIENRRNLVKYYRKKCEEMSINYIKVPNDNNFMFVIRVGDRDNLSKFLADNGIETRIIYPYPVPKQPAYNEKEEYPISEYLCRIALSLPLHSELKKQHIDYIMDKIKEFQDIKTYIFDIDGTFMDSKNDLNNYYEIIPDENMIKIINFLYDKGNHIIIETGRGGNTGIDWKDMTKEQLKECGIKYHELRFIKKPWGYVRIDDCSCSPEEFLNKVEL